MTKKEIMSTKELINWIRLWNPNAEALTLATIFAKMRSRKGSISVINTGSAGTGKSRSSLELLQELDLGNDIILDNTTTDKGLFDTFMEYPESDIVLDECSSLLRSLKTQDMVKMAMEGKTLTWTKDGSHEQTPPYKGNMIINTNVKIAEPVVDRCLVNKSVMNREMSLAFNELFIKEYMQATDFSPFVKYLRKVIGDKKEPELTENEMKMVLDFTQESVNEIDREMSFSRRIIIRQLAYYSRAKKLFGKLDKEVLDFVRHLADTYIVNDQAPGLIESIVGDSDINKAMLVKRVAKEGGYTEQHARRLINKAIEEGKLILKGKMVMRANEQNEQNEPQTKRTSKRNV